MTKLHPHCGQCSQCIDRRFAVLAAGQMDEDPAEAYKVDLLLGERQAGPDREMALAFVRSASAIDQMSDLTFFTQYGETSRIVGFFSEPADTVARRILGLHRRHAAAVCRIFDQAIALQAPALRLGSLPSTCLRSLIVSQREGEPAYPERSGTWTQIVTTRADIRMAVDERQRRIIFDLWGEIRGASAELLIALAKPFRQAMRDERAPEGYPFIETSKLMHETNCNSKESLRRRVLRCRNMMVELATNAGDAPPALDSVIESNQWHGYRLNPDRVRLVALTELPASAFRSRFSTERSRFSLVTPGESTA
jgi:hypothetical protein